MKKGIFFFLLLMILGGWIVLSPGVFTIPPTEGWLDGVTIIYVDKPSNVPFFSSPDFFCLEQTGGVSYSCRHQVIQGSSDLIRRELVRIPYVQWAYVQSTGGTLFEP